MHNSSLSSLSISLDFNQWVMRVERRALLWVNTLQFVQAQNRDRKRNKVWTSDPTPQVPGFFLPPSTFKSPSVWSELVFSAKLSFCSARVIRLMRTETVTLRPRTSSWSRWACVGMSSLDSDSSLSLAPVRETAAVIIDGKMFPSSQLGVGQAVLCVGKLLLGLRGTGGGGWGWGRSANKAAWLKFTGSSANQHNDSLGSGWHFSNQ